MPSTTLSLLQYLRITATALHKDTRPDSDLLARYATTRDETAFAALVVRHGALVWRVCRQILGNAHDVEDAFQATFLALSRKANQVRTGPLAGWLHQVARRAASDVRKAAGARQRLQEQLRTLIHLEAPPRVEQTETYEILHEELAGMLEKLRVPLVLHYLEGKTKLEIARILGVSESAVRKRLERGESILRERLTQQGICVGAATLATLLQEASSYAAIPTSLVRRTVEATIAFRSGTLDNATTALAQQVLQSLSYGTGWITKAWLVALACVSGLGAGAFVWRAASLPLPRAAADEPPMVAPAKEASLQPNNSVNQVHLDPYGDPLPKQALARLGTLRLRNKGSSQEQGGVNSVLFTSDGKTLFTAGATNPIRHWDIATGKLLRELDNEPGLNFTPAIILSPDKKTLAILRGGSISLCDIATGKMRFLNNLTSACIFSVNGKTLTTVDLHNHICVWEVASSKKLREQALSIKAGKHGDESFTHCIFSPDGKRLISINDGKSIQIWDTTTGKKLHRLPEIKEGLLHGSYGVSSNISFSPDSSLLAIASACDSNEEHTDGVVHLYDVATGKELRQIGSDKAGTWSVAFSPDGKLLATGSGGGPIHLWDVATGKEILSCNGYRAKVKSLTFSPDGKLLASGADGNDYTARLWEVATGKEAGPRFAGHTSAILSVNFSPDGKRLISGGRDGTVGIWDSETGRELRPSLRAGDFQSPAALSPDGKTIVSIGNTFTPDGKSPSSTTASCPSTIRFWDAATGHEQRQFPGAPGCTQSVLISPNGKYLLSTTWGPDIFGSVTRLWDLATGKQLVGRSAGGISSAAISPQGKAIAVLSGGGIMGGAGSLSFWKLDGGKSVFQYQAHKNAYNTGNGIAFSPDGLMLATSGLDEIKKNNQQTTKCTIRLWRIPPDDPWVVDAANDSMLLGHTGSIFALAFSPDCRTLASAGGDGTIRLWEVATGKVRHCFQGHRGEIWCLAFAPDGRRLASGSNDTTILIWDVTGQLDRGQVHAEKLTAKQIEQLWTDLASNDAGRTYQTIWKLVAASEQIVPFLKRKLRPVPVDKTLEQRVAQLVVELDDETFKVRKKAFDELKKLGELAEPSLRQAVNKPSSVETKKRINNLLTTLQQKRLGPTGDECRRIRTLEVLEKCHTQEARQLLEELAQGAPGALLTRDAQAILKRWK